MRLFHKGGTSTENKNPEVGCPVVARDGTALGTVKQVHGGYFEIDIPNDPGYWISSVYIESSGADRVRLSLDRRETAEHRLHAPGLSSEEDPHLADVADHIISDEEALAQRERMERELMRQRGGLDSELKE